MERLVIIQFSTQLLQPLAVMAQVAASVESMAVMVVLVAALEVQLEPLLAVQEQRTKVTQAVETPQVVVVQVVVVLALSVLRQLNQALMVEQAAQESQQVSLVHP
jgi:hypothetical protein